jgi:murein DD-endopeptidase MepM/ murein hydrolase activator NlpD
MRYVALLMTFATGSLLSSPLRAAEPSAPWDRLLVFERARFDRPEPPLPTKASLVRVIELNVGAEQTVQLVNDRKVTVKLVDLQETRDEVNGAVRLASVKVEVDGKPVTLISANYHLPQTVAGVRIDCPITRGCLKDSKKDTNTWGLAGDVRIRLWPADSPLLRPGTFVYPVKQRWFASGTQMANEPVFVNGDDTPSERGRIYYHFGLDIGGAEGMVDVLAATDGLVVSSGKDVLPGYEKTPVQPNYETVYVLDEQGWYYRYTHLQTIEAGIKPGTKVTSGQKLGLLGKEGSSGGWAHLHFDITSKQPSGQWGIQEGYGFLWEAYQVQYKTKILAVARPHHLAWTGQKVVLDGSRSWSAAGKIAQYEWTFWDGTTATGPSSERAYERPGSYSEILKVRDAEGRVAYDFAVVQVLDKTQPDRPPATIHAAYAPTFGIKPGDEVTFKVRTFRRGPGKEVWDFGDGSTKVEVQSDGNAKKLAEDGYAVTKHRFAKAGHYIARVERMDKDGTRAVAHVHVPVGEE